MELTFAQQSIAFLYSILLGSVLGTLYGAFKILRLSFDFGKVAIIITDIIFMLLSAFSMFLFSLAFLLGFVRVYIFIGVIIGFLAYRLTIGKFLSKLYCPIILLIKKLFHIIFANLKKFIKWLLKITNKILYNKDGKLRLFRSKSDDSAHNKKVMKDYEGKSSKTKRITKRTKFGKHRVKRNKTEEKTV